MIPDGAAEVVSSRVSAAQSFLQTVRIAVVGSRSVDRIDFDLVGAQAGDVIVSGGARGVDSLAEEEARRRGFAVVEFRPDYARYGRAAPHVRNGEIVASCDRLVAFWDGKSRGTKSTIDKARRYGKDVQIIEV